MSAASGARRGLRAWLDGAIMRKSVAAVLLPLLLLIVALWAIDRLEQQTARAEDDVRRTLQVLSDLHEAHSLLAETAAAVRGYRLVERDNFLDPYRLAEPRLRDLLRRLRAEIFDPVQAARLAQVTPLFEQKMRGWRDLLDPALPPEAVQQQLIDGKAKLDVLRAELRIMREYETSQLQARVRTAQRLRQRNLLITQAVVLCAGLGAVVAVAWFTSGLARRARRLAADAARLGEGRSLRISEDGADELGQLGRRLAEASRLLAERDAETRRAREDAEAANRAKTDFLSRSSHELRTPLNAILGYAQVLERELDGRQQGYAQRIAGAGRHLLGLIGELLDIARIEAGRLDVALSPVAVDALMEEAIALVRPMAEARAVRLEIAPTRIGDTPAPLWVRADAQRLRQVLLNLLGNAIKFNRNGGHVRLEAAADGERVRIGVRDDGPGVPEAQRERLFVPFERLGAERSAVEGTGLGLALSKRLTEAMGGEIGFESTPGVGTHVWVRLEASAPAAAPPSPRDAGVGPAEAAPPRRLLSVEDNPSNQALIETLLARRPQWRLHHAATLAQACARLGLPTSALSADGAIAAAPTQAAPTQAAPTRTMPESTSDATALPDAILLDLHLPDGRGESLIAAMRAHPTLARLPVIAITADATVDTLAAARAAGAAAVLTKPIDVTGFFAALDAALAVPASNGTAQPHDAQEAQA